MPEDVVGRAAIVPYDFFVFFRNLPTAIVRPFMVPDNRVSPYVEDPSANKKTPATEKPSSCDEASVVFALI
jgi:hypothetical protein